MPCVYEGWKVSHRKGLDETGVQEVPNSHAVEFNEEHLEQLKALREPEYKDPDAVVARSRLTASAVEKQLQMVDELSISVRSIISWKGASNLSTRCELSWHHKRKCYKTMQMKAKQLRITSFFTKSSVCSSTMQAMLVVQHPNFQSGIDSIPTNAAKNVHTFIIINLLHHRCMRPSFPDPLFPLGFKFMHHGFTFCRILQER
jgi:hypothetical protein